MLTSTAQGTHLQDRIGYDTLMMKEAKKTAGNNGGYLRESTLREIGDDHISDSMITYLYVSIILVTNMIISDRK